MFVQDRENDIELGIYIPDSPKRIIRHFASCCERVRRAWAAVLEGDESRTSRIDHHQAAKDELCAPRMFTHGHTLQLASVLRAHLVGLIEHTGLLPGIGVRVFVDIDSLLRPVYG